MNIFVGNLACTVTDQDLRQFFEPYGEVVTINVSVNPETGHRHSFGFVDMPERSSARAAIVGLHGMNLAGYACTVNEANWWTRDREPSRSTNQGSEVTPSASCSLSVKMRPWKRSFRR